MTDKTGTLTEGHSSFLKPLDVLGAVDDHVLALGLACSDKAGNELDRALWATAAPAQTRRWEMTIPTDNVDEKLLARPSQWDIRLIRRFMAVFGPISSAYDFLTFTVMLYVFDAGPTQAGSSEDPEPHRRRRPPLRAEVETRFQ